MKILQLIDSLKPGGAERMALNYWIALKSRSESSILVVTRKKGLWGKELIDDPNFYFLKKINTLDLNALWKLKNIIKKNEIGIVHAHGTSWFFAVLCKLSGSNFKLVWHDHYGNSQFLEKRPLRLLKLFSVFFDGIICVNSELKKWAREKLIFKNKIIYLPNFILEDKCHNHKKLKGETEFKLICVANLRPQKDHITLLKAFDIIQNKYSVSIHIFGVDFKDNYSENLKSEFSKRSEVYYYGEVSSTNRYLNDADIGILPSRSEGLPVALLEYGNVGLAVVCTDVGQCQKVTKDYAKIIAPGNAQTMADAIESYLIDPEARTNDGNALRKRITNLYSEKKVLGEYKKFIESIGKL